MHSLTSTALQIDRRVKGILRAVDVEEITQDERKLVQKVKLACNEIKLDVRDYEYAETLEAQQKWIKITRHNIKALETLILALGAIFGPADVAELGAQLELLQSSID